MDRQELARRNVGNLYRWLPAIRPELLQIAILAFQLNYRFGFEPKHRNPWAQVRGHKWCIYGLENVRVDTLITLSAVPDSTTATHSS